jgi:hypothetical protein
VAFGRLYYFGGLSVPDPDLDPKLGPDRRGIGGFSTCCFKIRILIQFQNMMPNPGKVPRIKSFCS